MSKARAAARKERKGPSGRRAAAPGSPVARRLADAVVGRTLEEFMPLLPAEALVRKAVRQGACATLAKERPKHRTQRNRVRGEFVRFLALGGDAFAPVHESGVDVEGAYVEGPLNLDYC